MPTTNPQPTAKPKVAKTPKVTHTEIGRIYLSRYQKNTLYSRGYWHKYATGVWSPVPDFEIEMEV